VTGVTLKLYLDTQVILNGNYISQIVFTIDFFFQKLEKKSDPELLNFSVDTYLFRSVHFALHFSIKGVFK